MSRPFIYCFFLTATPPTEIYTLSLHDALPIWNADVPPYLQEIILRCLDVDPVQRPRSEEQTSDSSHITISYAVFCLKKKKQTKTRHTPSNNNPSPQYDMMIPQSVPLKLPHLPL